MGAWGEGLWGEGVWGERLWGEGVWDEGVGVLLRAMHLTGEGLTLQEASEAFEAAHKLSQIGC